MRRNQEFEDVGGALVIVAAIAGLLAFLAIVFKVAYWILFIWRF